MLLFLFLNITFEFKIVKLDTTLLAIQCAFSISYIERKGYLHVEKNYKKRQKILAKTVKFFYRRMKALEK